MVSVGSQFYDNDENFEKYMERRYGKENANDTLEKPVILDLVGGFKGMKILDLGCGDATLGLEALNEGCQEYLGIEGSINMVEAANKTLKDTTGKVVHTTMESWDFPSNYYNLVISRLAIHYLEEIELIFSKIYKLHKSDGRFIFSVEHSVITSTLQPSGTRTNWIVDNYFINGFREQQWLGGNVYKFPLIFIFSGRK